jgi:serine phosphatase RsbU (regulator of sigma subunit)
MYNARHFLFGILLILPFWGPGQNLAQEEKQIDLLPDRPDKVDRYNKLSWEYQMDQPKETLLLVKKALALAQKLHYKKGIAQCLNDMGVCYHFLHNDKQELQYYLEALKVKEEIQDKRGMGVGYLNIGQFYCDHHQPKEGMRYLHKAVGIFKEIHNDQELAAAYNSISISFDENKYLDSAIFYTDKALEIRTRLKDTSGLSESYNNKASFLRDRNDLKGAEIYYEKDRDLCVLKKNNYGLSICLNNLSRLYQQQGKIDKAIAAAKQSAALSEEKGYIENLYYSFGNLLDFYKEKKDYKQSLHYAMMYLSVYDSLNKIEVQKGLTEMAAKYENEKKELEIRSLINENKAKQEQVRSKTLELQVKNEETKRANTQKMFFATGFILAVLMAFFIFRGYRSKQKANQIIVAQKTEVEAQKKMIEEKNNEIIDSINYAKRIQQSVITSQNYLQQHLQDFFVLFVPKDIVAGDFYWALDTEQGFMMATGDCTGHGVPGAFMSVIGINFLNEIASEKKITRPDLVLNELRQQIIRAMNPEGNLEGGNDGMDICLYVIEKNRKKLRYAAANNPLWMIRDGKLLEFGPDKMPVGKYSKDHIPFTHFEIDLLPGDMIYTFTDGYADQFGGPSGKKFKYKQLGELLQQIWKKPTAEQKNVLASRFEDWKGDLEQIDDVCIVGVRI